MSLDFVIRNGTIITAEEILQADLGVVGEKIAAIGSGLQADHIIDVTGMLVIPGGVDPHVHLEMPTATTRTSDDWHAGSLAALFGGTTTVIDFIEPNDNQPLLEALQERQSQADGHCFTDYSLHMTLTNASEETLHQVPEVVRAGVSSFKLYTTYSGFALTDRELLSALEAIKAVDGIALVHSENDAIIDLKTSELINTGKNSPRFYPESRPELAEVEAIQRIILLARTTGADLYIVHISTAGGAQAVEAALNSGQVLYGETCPQYLILDQSQYQNPHPKDVVKYICAPPLRTKKDQDALWEHLVGGNLQTIGTDHCAFNLIGQKNQDLDSFLNTPGGLPGVEPRLALIHTFGVGVGRLSLQQWVSACSTEPAKIFGLYPKKGALNVGSDADIVIFNPNLEVVITKSNPSKAGFLHEQVDYTPYEGLKLKGWPVATFLRGRMLINHQMLLEDISSGKFLTRPKYA